MFYNGETIKRGIRSQDRSLDKKAEVQKLNWMNRKAKEAAVAASCTEAASRHSSSLR
jgi:hypothetical protein